MGLYSRMKNSIFKKSDQVLWTTEKSKIGKSNGAPPKIYNAYNEEMHVFYLKDTDNIHTPYSLSGSTYPRWIYWDRFNSSLDTQFYVHENIFGKTYECKHKIGVLKESEEIKQQEFERALAHPEIINDYELILTHSERILNRYSNARFAPAGYLWYGTELMGGRLSAQNYELKERNISIISSDKAMCELHKIRAELARHYKNDTEVDAYGAAVGNYISKKADALEKYRYSIVLENSETPFYFTEKILDCFAAMTVPIYMGATRIGDFFNTDGIIQVTKSQLNDFSYMDKMIKQCSQEDYQSRLSAIIDNYNRVQEYVCYEDYIYNRFFR